jgi:alpha-glucosidase (family GH31 glycosyl hydrolase)
MQGTDEVVAYIPPGRWYDIWEGAPLDATSAGRNVTLDAPLGHVPIHVQGGHVIPLHEEALTTAEGWQTPLSLIVALPEPGIPRNPLP